MDGRQTDVLVLQEDKISYVLADKNLLSDSTGGGAVTSVPEVLGTQIARTEKYGISFNPESYVQWGYDRFFTDVKRGVVLQLRGNSFSNEELKVISEMNMRTWFRDTFNESFNTQKLGGFDPYMNEYVLSSNTLELPYNPECLECGISQTFTLTTLAEETKSINYCVDLGPTVGLTDVNYSVAAISEGAQFEIVIDYNGVTDTTGWVSTGGTLTFNKDTVSVETVSITINYTGDIVLNVLADCCNAASLTIVQIVLTNDYDSGDTIHTQYRYVDGAFISPLQSSLVTFASGTDSPLISRYNVTTNYVGTGAFPPAGSTMTMISNQFATDTFVFNPATDKFKYLVSDTLYGNNTTDVNTLLGLATTATPNQGGGTNNYADFTVPALQDYLYLVWDFRAAIPATLCFSATLSDACCGCGTPTVESYNCVSGTCTDPGDGTGTYATLGECESACTAPTTVQLDWNVGNQSGGQLVVFNNAMSEILNITSTAGSVQSGTIYPSVSELPYTIRGEWVSGSGNTIRYNICDIIGGGLIYESGAITIVEEFEDYVVSPTPYHALVSLRAQNVTPPTCPV
jgi:hypothetical protein